MIYNNWMDGDIHYIWKILIIISMQTEAPFLGVRRDLPFGNGALNEVLTLQTSNKPARWCCLLVLFQYSNRRRSEKTMRRVRQTRGHMKKVLCVGYTLTNRHAHITPKNASCLPIMMHNDNICVQDVEQHI